MEIGEKIKGIRRAKGYTLDTLAKLSGISKGYLSKIEKLHNKNIGLEVLDKITQALDITEEYLISHKDIYPGETFNRIAVCESYKMFFSGNNFSSEDRRLLEMAFSFRRDSPPDTVQGWRDQLDLLKFASRQGILPIFNNSTPSKDES